MSISLNKLIALSAVAIVSTELTYASLELSNKQYTAQLQQRRMSNTVNKQLDPQAKALLDKMAAMSANIPTRSLSPKEEQAAARQGYRDIISLAGKPEKVFKVENRQIPGPVGDIPVRIYTPNEGSNLPILVFFHGGGFTVGDLDTHDTPLRSLANRAECIIVSVDYRLAPEHPFPAAPEDAYATTKWVAEHAKEINGNAKRIAVGGDSAGGNLAAVVALMARDRFGPDLVYQLLIYPNTDASLDSFYPSWQQNDGMILSKAGMEQSYGQYVPNDVDRKNAYISPLYAESLKNLPPALIITGEFDPLRDEGEAYATRLEQAGVKVVATRYNGMIHGFLQMAGELDDGKMLVAQAATALKMTFLK